jgi:hypothetical protein
VDYISKTLSQKEMEGRKGGREERRKGGKKRKQRSPK